MVGTCQTSNPFTMTLRQTHISDSGLRAPQAALDVCIEAMLSNCVSVQAFKATPDDCTRALLSNHKQTLQSSAPIDCESGKLIEQHVNVEISTAVSSS